MSGAWFTRLRGLRNFYWSHEIGIGGVDEFRSCPSPTSSFEERRTRFSSKLRINPYHRSVRKCGEVSIVNHKTHVLRISPLERDSKRPVPISSGSNAFYEAV